MSFGFLVSNQCLKTIKFNSGFQQTCIDYYCYFLLQRDLSDELNSSSRAGVAGSKFERPLTTCCDVCTPIALSFLWQKSVYQIINHFETTKQQQNTKMSYTDIRSVYKITLQTLPSPGRCRFAHHRNFKEILVLANCRVTLSLYLCYAENKNLHFFKIPDVWNSLKIAFV